MIGALVLGKMLMNKYIICGVLIATAFVGGMLYQYTRHKTKEVTKTVTILKEVIREKDKINRKYRGNTFKDEMILSGCVPEAAKGQPHCKEVK